MGNAAEDEQIRNTYAKKKGKIVNHTALSKF